MHPEIKARTAETMSDWREFLVSADDKMCLVNLVTPAMIGGPFVGCYKEF